jgi:hypothetical protein
MLGLGATVAGDEDVEALFCGNETKAAFFLSVSVLLLLT